MKKYILILIGLLVSGFTLAQTSSENYIKTTTFQVETTSGSVTDDEKIETITYHDGLGRTKQVVVKQNGGNKEDNITPIKYDPFGRQHKEYLPYSRTTSSLNYENPLTSGLFSNLNNQYLSKHTDDFNNSTAPNPYGQTAFDASPLNRVSEVASAGYDWRYDESNMSLVDIQVPIPLDFSTSVSADQFPNGNVGSLGQVTIDISNTQINMHFDMIFQPTQLMVGQIAYLDTAPYILGDYFIGQLSDESGNLIPYFVQIQNNHLVITSTNPSYYVEGLNSMLSINVDIAPVDFVTYQKKLSLNNTIRYEYGTNSMDDPSDANVKKFAVEFTGDANETRLIYVGNYHPKSLYKTIIKDENWQLNSDPTIVEKNNTVEEYKDKLGRTVLRRTFDNNEAHDTYYVYDKYGNLTYVIPPLAADEILVVGDLGFRVASQINYSWTALVEVDKSFAEEYNKKLKDYANEDILNADLENEYAGQGGFTVSTFENSDVVTLSLTFSSAQPLTLKQGEILSLKQQGEFKDTELGKVVGSDFEYYFLIKNNAIVVEKSGKGKGELTTINQTFTSTVKLSYSQENLWTNYIEVDPKFVAEFEKNVTTKAKETNQSILTTFLENQYGGHGGIQISISDNDIVTININNNLNIPLKLKQGLVIPFETKRRISDRELGSISGDGYDYYFAIKENALFINGHGLITNLNMSFSSPPLPETPTINSGSVGGLCYIYHYDDRNRVKHKKVPGKGWQYLVYDNLERPILTQDAKMRLSNQWFFTKYDALGRVTYTGIYTYTPTGVEYNEQLELQNIIDNQSSPVWFENKLTSSQVIDGTTIYYTNSSYPTTNLEVLTINYYDNYTFDNAGIALTLPTTVLGQNVNDQVRSLATASKVRILGTNDWITTLTYYDDKSRPIYVVSKNEYLNTLDFTKTNLNFVGKVLIKEMSHTKDSNTEIVTVNNYTYDHRGRLLTQIQSINGSSNELIVNNTYNEYGQFVEKKVGGNVATIPENSNGLQTVNFENNIRGWLKSINNGVVTGGDLFGFKINYNTPEHSGVTPLYNGNISETHWVTANDNKSRSYNYNYDALNRVKAANYHGSYQVSNAAPGELEDYSLNAINYDKNGNITSLQRSGFQLSDLGSGNHQIDIIDNLSYTIAPLSNQLMSVHDAATKDGFNNQNVSGDDYSYDINGNLVVDKNKNIQNIEYNHLNLPTKITTTDLWEPNYIDYTYTATGIKIMKKVTEDIGAYVLTKETIYSNDFIYEKHTGGKPAPGTPEPTFGIKFINHPEGYIEPQDDGSFSYVYQFKDHLGNIRLAYQDMNDDGSIDPLLEIKEENNYYPFGLKHKGYNNSVTGRDYNYGYGGKEENDELGLQWLDFSARNYEASLGRWFVVDALSDEPEQIDKSPYAYSWNNPIYFTDPDGNCPKCPGGFGAILGINIGIGSRGLNFNVTSSIGYEYRTENFQAAGFLSGSIYSGQQLGTSSLADGIQYDMTAGVYGTIGSGSGTPHNFYTLNYNTASPFANSFDTSFSYGQMLTYNSAINTNQGGPGVQIQGLLGMRLGENFSFSSNNDSDAAPYFSRALVGGESTDAGWTGGLVMNISGIEFGYQNFTGFREGSYPGGGLGTKYAQTVFDESLNRASNFLRFNNSLTIDFYTDGWFQSLIHNKVSKESTYNYNNLYNFNGSGSWHDYSPSQNGGADDID